MTAKSGPSGTGTKSSKPKPSSAKAPTTKVPKGQAAKGPAVSASTTATRSSTRAASQKPVATKAKPVPAQSENDTPEITKKELIARMVQESGMKPGEARKALDATLSVLRSALREEGEISAAPLGKIRVTRKKATKNGDLVVCRIKLKDPKPASDAPDEAPQ